MMWSLGEQRGVHRVAGDHGLFDHRMVAADDDTAPGRVANDDFAGFAALVEVWRLAVTHGDHLAGAGAGAGFECSAGDSTSSICTSRLNINLKKGRRRMSKNVT